MKKWAAISCYVKKYYMLYALTIVFTILEVLVGIMHPRLIEKIIDIGIQQKDITFIVRMGMVMLGLCLIGYIFGMGSTIISGQIAAEIGHSLRTDLFSKIIYADIQESNKINKSALFARISGDCHSIMEFFAEIMHTAVKPLTLFFGGMGMLFMINPLYGLMMIAAVGIELTLMFYLYRRTNRMFLKISLKMDRLIKILRQNIIGARLVKIFSKEQSERERYKKMNCQIKEDSTEVFEFSARMNIWIMLIMNMVILSVIMLGGIQAQHKTVHVGQILASITYSQQVMMSVMSMGLLFHTFAETKVAVERIEEILNLYSSDLCSKLELDEEIREITFQNVSFIYEGKTYLKNISFSIKAGEKIGILGETASGKTLLVNLLLGIYPISEGVILINGKNAEEYSWPSIRKHITAALQENSLFSGTVEENISWGRAGEPQKAAKEADIDLFIEYSGAGYKTKLYDKGQNLSGGQRQRLQLARALYEMADVLIIDDAISQIDAESKLTILKNIERKQADKITILTSQRYMPYFEKCHKVIVLQNGEMIAAGTHPELMNKCSLYQTFCLS